MRVLEKLFNWMVFMGMLLLVGRLVTVIMRVMDIPFITFFKDYSVISFIILIVGAIGSQVLKDKHK